MKSLHTGSTQDYFPPTHKFLFFMFYISAHTVYRYCTETDWCRYLYEVNIQELMNFTYSSLIDTRGSVFVCQ